MLLGVVPVETLAGAVRDVGEQSALGQPVPVLYIARGAFARFDCVQEFANVTGGVGNGLRGRLEVLFLLPLHVNLVAVVIGDQCGRGTFEDDAAAHRVEARAPVGVKGPGEN